MTRAAAELDEKLDAWRTRSIGAITDLILDADEPAEAERRPKDVVTRHQKTAPQLAAWLAHAISVALTELMIPAAHRRRLRTTNSLDRLKRDQARHQRKPP